MISSSSIATTPARVVAYLRTSAGELARGGASLAVQRARVDAYAKANRLELVTVYKDSDASGELLARRGLRAALKALDDGKATGLLVFKLDRLTRSIGDLRHLLDEYFCNRFILSSVSDRVDTRTASGRLALGVLASVTGWEREALSGRRRAPVVHEGERGVRLGRPPLESLGPDGAATVERARQLRQQGLALRTIADVLTKEGRPTAHGGLWAAETVRLLLLRAPGRALDAPPASRIMAATRTSSAA